MHILPKQSFLADMLGLGPAMDMMQSPEFQAQLRQFVADLVATNAAVKRIEAKLDQLLLRAQVNQAPYQAPPPPSNQFTRDIPGVTDNPDVIYTNGADGRPIGNGDGR